jgi:hypothetical protein
MRHYGGPRRPRQVAPYAIPQSTVEPLDDNQPRTFLQRQRVTPARLPRADAARSRWGQHVAAAAMPAEVRLVAALPPLAGPACHSLTAANLDGMMPPGERLRMERYASRLSRRQLVVGAAGLGLVAGCGRLPWQAQPPQPRRDGYLGVGTASSSCLEAFRSGMRDLGYVEETNLAVEYRFAEGDRGRLPGLASELVDRNVEVIVTHFPYLVDLETTQALGITLPNEVVLQVTEIIQ